MSTSIAETNLAQLAEEIYQAHDEAELKIHPIAAIFPLLEGEALSQLADDIREHGLRDPICLYEGKVLDGRNRAAACALAGVTPKTYEFKNVWHQLVPFYLAHWLE